MKIKRFEAQSMSDALRMIKKEFGEEAVILSATNAKKSGKFFSPKGSRQVVVTAAIDMAPAKVDSNSQMPSVDTDMINTNQFNGLQTDSLKKRSNSILERFQPITKTGRKKLQPKLVHLMSEQHPAPSLLSEPHDHLGDPAVLYDNLCARGLPVSIARDLADQTAQLLAMAAEDRTSVEEALAQVIAAKSWVAPGLPLPSKKGNCLVLVGTHGAGKTAAAAKLAATCVLSGLGTPAVVSIDHQRAAATQELQRLTRIMGITLHVAADHRQLARICRDIGDHRPVIVDTPGICPSDDSGLNALDEMLKELKGAQIHQVINACLQGKVIRSAIDFFRPLGVSRLLFTQLDSVEDVGHILNQVEASSLPMAYLSNGPQVPDGLLRATPGMLVNLLLTGNADQDHDHDEMSIKVIPKTSGATAPQKYVANCNSDIFHDVSCKSVVRMNQDHILVFDDALDAKAQGFNPCRMCCSELFVPKPHDRLIRTRQTIRQQAL